MAKKIVDQTAAPTAAQTAPVSQTGNQTEQRAVQTFDGPSEDQSGNGLGSALEQPVPLSTYDEVLAEIIATQKPLNFPIVKVMCQQTEKEGEWDAEFTGQAVCRLTDMKFAKSNSGSPQIWLRGIVVRDYPADIKDPEAQKENPNSFCYSLRPGSDFQNMEGYKSVVGYPFITTVTLTKAAVGKDVGAVEVSVNTLASFGYRGLGPLDFIPAKGESSVLARNLPKPEFRGDGNTMDAEVLVEFVYKQAEGNFPARVQVKKVSAINYRANVDEVAMLQNELADFFVAALAGRVNTRKVAVEGIAARKGYKKGGAVGQAGGGSGSGAPAGQPAQGAVGATAGVGHVQGTASSGGTAGMAAVEQTGPTEGKCGKKIHGGGFCNKLPGHDMPSKDADGKAVVPTACNKVPF